MSINNKYCSAKFLKDFILIKNIYLQFENDCSNNKFQYSVFNNSWKTLINVIQCKILDEKINSLFKFRHLS